MLFLAFVMATQVACTSSTSFSTEVRILVHMDESLDSQQLRVRVFDTDRALVSDEMQALDGAERPTIKPLYPDGEGDRSYHVVMELLGPGGESLGTQRVIGEYVDEERRVLNVRFSATCSSMSCSGRETCRDEGGAASCVQACFDPQPADVETLPNSNECPRAVYVDDATGEDDPDACFGPEAPCKDVGYALDEYLSSRTGGTIYVAGGSTYPGFFIRGEQSGTPDTPTTVQAWPGTGRPIFDGEGTGPTINTCCTDDSATHLVLAGLEVTRGLGQGIQLHGRAVQAAVIRDCVVTGTVLPATVPFSSQAGAIVVTNRASSVEIINNTVRDNVGESETSDGEAVRTFGISVTGNSNTVEGNLLENNAGYGILLIGEDNRVAANRVINSGFQGMLIYDADDVVLEDNIVCMSGGHGIEIGASRRGELRHNTIIQSGESGVMLRESSGDWRVTQNIFANNGEFGLARIATEESEPSDSQNLYWMNLSGATDFIEADGTDYTTVMPSFVGDACEGILDSRSEAATLIEGGPIGARPNE